MADIHVSTIAELKTALQTSGANVFLDNDLDFNSVTFGSSTWCNVQATDFDGQGHTIYNIQSGSSGTVFIPVVGINFTVHNVNFYNLLLLGSGKLFDGYNSSNKNCFLSECKIQGKAKTLFGSNMSVSPTGVRKTNIKINGDCDLYAPSFSLCYFDFDSASSDTPTTYSIRFTDCYIKGHLRFKSTIYSSECNRNVWNCFNDNNTTPTLYTVSGGAQLYNSDRCTFATSSSLYPLTTAQLKDRDYIANNTNFPIL